MHQSYQIINNKQLITRPRGFVWLIYAVVYIWLVPSLQVFVCLSVMASYFVPRRVQSIAVIVSAYLSVGLSACICQKPCVQTSLNFLYITCGHGSVVLWWQYNASTVPVTFVDDVFSHNGPWSLQLSELFMVPHQVAPLNWAPRDTKSVIVDCLVVGLCTIAVANQLSEWRI